MNIKHALTALGIVVAMVLANANGQSYYSPTQLRQAYGLSGLQASGSGQTVAIIVDGSYPNAVTTLDTFSAAYNLPAMSSSGAGPTLTQLNETGGSTSLPPTGWTTETAMDMEYVHAMAPEANIILYETNSTNVEDYLDAAQAAGDNPAASVVTSSWQIPEFGGENGYDYLYATPASRGKNGVTFCASTGDHGDIDESPGNGLSGYPAVSPNVVAVGGTSLYLTGSGAYNYETAWSWNSSMGSGGSGGTSNQGEPKPSYQTTYGTTHPGNVLHTTTSRAIPDVSMDANPNTGVMIYDPENGGWYAQGGTSLASPCFAGLIADADGMRAANGFTSLDGPTQTLPALYSLSGDFHDITSGNISPTGNPTYSATTGYDLATGLGSPIANQLVPDLANWGINSCWALATSANWSNNSNWTDGVPDVAGGSAAISVPTTSQVKITLDEPVTLGSLLLGNSASPSAGYTLSGSGANRLTFNNSGSGDTITVTGGSQQINAPVVLNGNLLVAGYPLAGGGAGAWMLSFGSAAGIADGAPSGSGSFSLTMCGSDGKLVLGGSNTYRGGTTISAGTLQLGNGGASGSVVGGIVIGAGGTLVLDRSDNLTLGNAISGGGTLTKTGGDSLTLSNATAFSGSIVVAQGQLVLSGTNTSQCGTAVLGGQLIVADSYSLANGTNLTVGSAAPFAAIIPETAASSADQGHPDPVPEPATPAIVTAAVVLLAVRRLCRRGFHQRLHNVGVSSGASKARCCQDIAGAGDSATLHRRGQ